MADLQDILDRASDEDEDDPSSSRISSLDEDNLLSPMHTSLDHNNGNHHTNNNRRGGNSGDLDLEQILREDDDDDDDLPLEDFHDAVLAKSQSQNSYYSYNTNDSHTHALRKPSPPGFAYSTTLMPMTTTTNNHHHLSDSKHDEADGDHYTQTSSSSYLVTSSSTATAHNEEDWAVLQAILREDDDDDEEDDDNDEDSTLDHARAFFPSHADEHKKDTNDNDTDDHPFRTLTKRGKNDSYRSSAIPTSSPVIEDLLAQSTDEEDDDDDTNSNTNHFNLPFPSFSSNNSNTKNSQQLLRSMNTTSNTDETHSFLLAHSHSSGLTSIHLPAEMRTKALDTTSNTTAAAAADQTVLQEHATEMTDEEASQRAWEHAQAYEKRLLKAGHRDIVSPLMVKRRLKPKVALAKRSTVGGATQPPTSSSSTQQQQQQQPPSSSSSPRFYSSGLIDQKRLGEISTSMTKHAGTEAKVQCGLPTCVAFNSRFIAIGTQLGIVLLYDLFGALRQRLGASYHEETGMRMIGSITSVDLNMSGECCAVGYKSGMVVLWDCIKGTVLRTVDDLHPSPIISVRFFTELKLVSADSGGLVNKVTFTKNMLWSTYSMDYDCLLDGTAGQILAVNVLEPHLVVQDKLKSKSMMVNRTLRSLSLIALSSERSSFAVAVEPKVNVLHRWPRPPQERVHAVFNPGQQEDKKEDEDSAVYLPCLAWGWALTSGGGNVAMPMLARSWGCCLQLLNSTLPTLDDDPPPPTASGGGEEPVVHWPAFGMHEEFDAESPIVAMEWLSERSLAYLTVTNELTVVDTVVMTLLERVDFSGMGVVFAEFTLSRTAARAMTGNDGQEGAGEERISPITCTSFQNSVRCFDKRLMILCKDELCQITMVSSRQRIASLEADGEWLEALALALDHYEGTYASQEDRKRDQNGFRDISRHPEFSSPKGDDEEWIAKLLLRYLNLAVDNAPNSSAEDNLMSLGNGRARINLAQSHFQMLAGVCVEYCVTTKRLDLLFGPIFQRFHNVGYTAVFLDVLEPYVLNDRLSYIAPEVMSYFVDHCRSNNGIATVERCLLHMDCTIMDFDSIIALLRNNDMYTAMFFVFNQGLKDYVSPLQMLLERVFEEADSGNAIIRRPSSSERRRQNNFDKFGYKAILYLRFCFEGKSFPKEEKMLSDDIQASVKPELLNFLTQPTYTMPSHAARKSNRNSSELVGHRAHLYPYMRLLIQVDPSLFLETISIALSENVSFEQQLAMDAEYEMSREQVLVDIFTGMILPELSETPTEHITLFKSRQATSAFLDFTAKYITRGLVRVKKSLTLMIAKRIADRFIANANNPAARKSAQGEIMELLSALPRESYEPDKVLALIERAGIHRAALLLHQQVASSWQDGADDIQSRAHHFCSAIDCFIDDDDPEFRLEVFDYIRKECTGISRTGETGEGASQRALAEVVYSRFRRLVRLDALMTARMVAELFVEDLDVVVDSLDDGDGGEAQFLFLQAIVSGELLEVDPVAGSVLNPSMDHHYKYLSLLVRLHPEQVYEYLSKHDNYRAEDALKLCEEYQIADASAYLLERTGNISSALQLILQTLEGRLMSLKRTLRGMEVDMLNHHHIMRFGPNQGAAMSHLPRKQAQEADGVRRILVVALDLCERNSGSYNSQAEHGSQLWFNVLDRLINAKGFLRLVNEQRDHARLMEEVLNDLLRITMQRMVSNVPLLDLVRKVTSDHSGSRLGELREMVMSLVGTYRFELTLFNKAADVFHEDIASMKTNRADLVRRATPAVNSNPALFGKGGHLSSNDSTFFVDGERKGIVLDSNSMQQKHSARGGMLKQTMSKLRNRRQRTNAATSSVPSGVSTSDDLVSMTQRDRNYYEGSTEPVIFQHAVGILGEAHHRGRLISFRE